MQHKSMRPNVDGRERHLTTRQAVCSEGNYGVYIDDLKRRKGADADLPHRVAYKRLLRA